MKFEAKPASDERSPGIRAADVAGLVLCGGRSTRMGRDKALLRGIDGDRTRLEAAVALLDPWVGEGRIACGTSPRYTDLLARTPRWELVLDDLEHAGPLAGLAAGLAAGSRTWTLALAVDMPGIGAAEIEALLAAARPDDDIVCFDDARGPQPLVTLYHRRCRAPIAAALAAGERKMTSFWERPVAAGRPLALRSVALPRGGTRLREGAVGECPESAASTVTQDPLRNLNTPDEWALERAARTVEE